MNQPAFYLAKQECEFRIRTYQGESVRVGRPAYVPALPGLKFYYRQEDNEHILTEASTGLALAREPFYGIHHLHQQVAITAKRYGVEGTLKHIERWGRLKSVAA